MIDQLAMRSVLFQSSTVPCSPLLLPHVSTLLFSRTVDILPQPNSLTQRFPPYPLKNWYLLVILVVSSLACVATDNSLLLNYCLSRICRIEIPSCSACGHPTRHVSHLILHCPAMNSLLHSLFGDSLSQSLESCPASGADV